MPPEMVIKAEGLTKRYGATLAVDHIELEVDAGEIVGILGPNGSGKTTTILMLLGLTEPTSGWALVAGHDPLRNPLEVKRRVGYLPDQIGFYDGLSARENLAYTDLLAGHAPAPRPRRNPDEAAERRHPRRADNRARPAFDAGISRDDPPLEGG